MVKIKKIVFVTDLVEFKSKIIEKSLTSAVLYL